MGQIVDGRYVRTAEENAKRVKPVGFKYNNGKEVVLNEAAAEILEKRGDGKITKAEVKPVVSKPESK